MTKKVMVDVPALLLGLQHLKSIFTMQVQAFYNAGDAVAEIRDIPTSTQVHFIKVLSSQIDDLPEQVVNSNGFSDPAYFYAILIAIAPHLNPHFFDEIVQNIFQKAVDFPQIGGVRTQRRSFLPTLETLMFLCAGKDLSRRLEIQRFFEEDQFFFQNGIFRLEEVVLGEPVCNSKLVLSLAYVDLLLIGEKLLPKLSYNFPAQKVDTLLDLDDLILNEQTLLQCLEIENWIKYGRELEKDPKLQKHLKKGYRVLFHGPPGTGKTITAGVLGKRNDKLVFVIDLSMVVSKYIGETEKNLAELFNRAEHEDWILFFDEADALFGKRSNVKDAHDRYANQEIAYLLQRIESYDGLVIMASNMKKNIDEAFLRRFQSVIHFALPSAKERIRIWQQALPVTIPLSPQVDLEEIARKYKISGASIISVLHFCSLQAKGRENGSCQLCLEDFITGIQREMAKEGRGMM